MSNKQKGRKNERLVDRLYQQAGYWTYRPENASYGDNDLWNWFDVAAVADTPELDPQLILTQVKTNSTQGEITEFFEATTPFQALRDHTVHFVVVYDGHGGPHAKPATCRLAVPADGRYEYEWVVDERDADVEETGELVVEYLREGNDES